MAKGPVFRLTPENALRSELQAGKVRPAYFFYGEEDFLTRTYTDMVIKTAGALSLQELRTRRFFHVIIISGEEALENRVFGLLLGETKGLEL